MLAIIVGLRAKLGRPESTLESIDLLARFFESTMLEGEAPTRAQ